MKMGLSLLWLSFDLKPSSLRHLAIAMCQNLASGFQIRGNCYQYKLLEHHWLPRILIMAILRVTL